ncbi:hypothetical protein [Pontibacter harenae]|uniref:hypothetical protein n=1 Tax=Pontibacter harenae TaxID=2894083 RepID=UPI001E2971A3|nr:hypothetical protein [Pontibacter harenae]MCC9167079.1 hypothetical protein [Pontibacter harenae]
MDLYLLLPGILILAITIFDIIYTVLAPGGSGLVSGAISNGLWKIFYGLSRAVNKRQVLTGAGVTTVVAIVIGWVMLLWIGNFLILKSDQNSVINSSTGDVANSKQVFYYTGYVLSTMGNGDYKGGSDNWQIFSAVISFSGLIMITIAITYIVPVVAAVTDRRTLSIQISSIGHSVQSMLLTSWNGKDFKSLESDLHGISQNIARQGQLHYAYPVLHFFHHQKKVAALLPNLAALDEALTILYLYVQEEKRPSHEAVLPVRIALTTFLESLQSSFIKPAETAPPLKIELLKEAGLPLLEPDQVAFQNLDLRRRMLKSMIAHDGWTWEEIDQFPMNRKMDDYDKFTL